MKDGLIQFSHCNKKSNLNYIFSYASVYNPRLGNIYETIETKYKSGAHLWVTLETLIKFKVLYIF